MAIDDNKTKVTLPAIVSWLWKSGFITVCPLSFLMGTQRQQRSNKINKSSCNQCWGLRIHKYSVKWINLKRERDVCTCLRFFPSVKVIETLQAGLKAPRRQFCDINPTKKKCLRLEYSFTEGKNKNIKRALTMIRRFDLNHSNLFTSVIKNPLNTT